MFKIETCFSPALYNYYEAKDRSVVVIDILRATTSICTAIASGAKELIPVATIAEAKEYKNKGYIVAAERDGQKLDFADFGNSPSFFTPSNVKGKTIVYNTTNGTQTIKMTENAKLSLIGSFINLKSIINFLTHNKDNILLFCSGWKNMFNLEDTLCAGAIAQQLLNSGEYITNCDSTHAAIDLWNLAKDNLLLYTKKASHRTRLNKLVSENILEYCFSLNIVDVVPCFKEGKIVDILRK
ncbi:MAG: 2-phosphosulfolactate phosphatase [Bacteroidales bacterium]|nr:2-phosphosulfolactate phosphatase [Bacteroidales bacterium]